MPISIYYRIGGKSEKIGHVFFPMPPREGDYVQVEGTTYRVSRIVHIIEDNIVLTVHMTVTD